MEVRESAPITTPPSNSTAMIVLGLDALLMSDWRMACLVSGLVAWALGGLSVGALVLRVLQFKLAYVVSAIYGCDLSNAPSSVPVETACSGFITSSAR